MVSIKYISPWTGTTWGLNRLFWKLQELPRFEEKSEIFKKMGGLNPLPKQKSTYLSAGELAADIRELLQAQTCGSTHWGLHQKLLCIWPKWQWSPRAKPVQQTLETTPDLEQLLETTITVHRPQG